MNCWPCSKSGIVKRAMYYTAVRRVPVCKGHAEMVWNAPSRERLYWMMRPGASRPEAIKVAVERRGAKRRSPQVGTMTEKVLKYTVGHLQNFGKLPSPTSLALTLYGDKKKAGNAYTTVNRLIARGLIKLEVGASQ